MWNRVRLNSPTLGLGEKYIESTDSILIEAAFRYGTANAFSQPA